VFIKTSTIALVLRRLSAAMHAASTWARKRSDAAAFYLHSSLGFSPIWRWLGAKLWAGVCAFGRLVQSFLVPKGDAPLDVLKHYVSVLIVLIGAGALLWSAKQIAYPPLVITVAKLPDPLEKEYWVNPELSRTLIDQIERIRAVVKGDRDPTFEAVLDPPNIIVKSGDWSLNFQEQILTPLGSLLGRGQGEVHLSLTCYHPGCARSNDNECREPAPPGTADAKTPAKQYLCLRLTADIKRGATRRRLTPRLVLSNDDADLTQPLARVAEAVTAVSDPATAALYFYRRMREESVATGSFTYDPDLVAELFNEAAQAAEQAESNDVVSACWAHSVRAHLAIDRREFSIAKVYLSRARSIPWWRHLGQFTLPLDCERLIAIAEMEFARQLARRPRSDSETYLLYEDDSDEKRVLAAYRRIQDVQKELKGSIAAWTGFISRSASGEDLDAALELAKAEISLNFFTPSDQCQLVENKGPPETFDRDSTLDLYHETAGSDDARRDFARGVWGKIKTSLDRLEAAESQLMPLTRQATLNFLAQYALNKDCAEKIVDIAERLFVNHANDSKIVHLLVGVTEAAALKKTENLGRPATEGDRRNPQLLALRNIYQRMVDTGADRSGGAINRLAFLTEAIRAEEGDDGPSAKDPTATLRNLIRAWRRYQRERYPADMRPQAEFAVQFWGSVLMRSFTEEFLTADLSRQGDLPPALDKEKLRTVLSNNAEFQSALQALYPGMQAARLSDLPQLPEIGPRIGCMCMLSYVTLQEELADFFITRLNRWQQVKIELPVCRRDLIPRMQTSVRPNLSRIERLAKEQVTRAEVTLKTSSAPTSAMQEAVDKANERYQRAAGALQQARRDVEEVQKAIVRKHETIAKAEEICYMTPKAVPPVPRVSQAATAPTEAAAASTAATSPASDPKPEPVKP
jgi:hypothetical protein